MSIPISQREARRMRKRLSELERQEDSRLNAWAREYPGGEHIASEVWEKNDKVPVAIRTARLLKHAVVAVARDDGSVHFYGLPLKGGGR